MSQKIRIKLKSYDHNLVDKSAEKIVRTVKATGAIVKRSYSIAYTQAYFHVGSRADSGREHERDTGYNFIRVRKGGSFSIRLLSDYGEKKPDFPPVSDKVCGALSL